jgi:polyisoprenoid-binding protein YceI
MFKFTAYLKLLKTKKMKKRAILLITIIAVLTSAFTISMIWNIDDQGTAISFELPDQGTKGTLSGLKATIDFDQKDPSSAKINASVEVKTLNTGDKQKDNHLLSADFFNAEKYPTISFVSTSVKAIETGFLATGNLTMKDSTKIVEIPFTFSENTNGGGAFKGTMTVFSGDYGVTKKSGTGKDKIIVNLTVPVKK